MGRIDRWYVVLVAALLFGFGPMAQSRTIQVATSENFPFSSAQTNSGGVEIDLIRAAFAVVGHKVEVTFFSWPRAMKNVKSGYYDLITSVYYSDERNEYLKFSNPLYRQTIGLVALRSLGIEHFDDLRSLDQYRIGVVDGAIVSDTFDHADYLNKVKAHDSRLNIEGLYRGELDLVATSFIHFNALMDVLGDYNPADVIFLEPSLSVRTSHIAVSRAKADHEQLLVEFNLGLEMIKASGEYDAIWRAHKMPPPALP